MRTKIEQNGITLQAIAGSYVVLLGWSMTKHDSKNILGFAIHRTDRTENEAYWLEGFKVFKETDPGKQKASLRQHPVQGFTWLDLTAKSGHDYLYRVVALKGKPTNLQEDASASVEVATELETKGTQSVWFNRGAAASQEYARRFNNRRPDEVGPAAFKWLSRGLWEAMQAFITQANGPKYGLRVAAYQFQYGPALAAFKAASETGADVQIIYDARKPDPAESNRAAAAAANIENLCTERTSNPSAIAHNKFIVLLKDDQPIAVWTGSTNFSEGGIFGHSNVGHEVRSSDVAKEYLAYWEILKEDPDFNALRPRISEITPTPSSGSSAAIGTTELFSPRTGLQLLDWYASQAASASMLVCMTFPFGINKAFVPTFQTPFAGLRYALFDSAGTTTEAKQIVLDLRKRPDNRFAIGSYLVTNKFDKWIHERLSGLNKYARYIHTKYMLIDPFGDDPIIITGSANFSDASTRDNDENMLVIRGEKTVADIYVTEYFRLWNHYAFREWAAAQGNTSNALPQFLKTDDSWRNIYYGDTEQARQRWIMSGIGFV
jgi:phosphatidylserine/phosphatidylglycerophosphate/cardiolipin synthase-like enzyme